MPDNRASEYRRLARDCLQVAKSMSTEEGRTALIEMARVWSRLADEQEVLGQIPMPEDSQPAMQQQAQVQPKKDEKE
jgi:hypothetical protein